MPRDNFKFLYRSTFRNVLSILKPTCKNVKKMLGTWERVTRAYIYALGSQRVKDVLRESGLIILFNSMINLLITTHLNIFKY